VGDYSVVVVASVELAVDGGFAGADGTMTDAVDASASVEIVDVAVVELAT
jgi:hypothetical protein